MDKIISKYTVLESFIRAMEQQFQKVFKSEKEYMNWATIEQFHKELRKKHIELLEKV